MKHRHNVEPIFLTSSTGDMTEECRKNGIEFIIAKNYGWFDRGYELSARVKGSIKYLLNKFYYHGKILRLLKNQHFDIIHTNSSWSQTGDVVAQHFSLPHVWHFRDSLTDNFGYKYTLSDDYVRSRFDASSANITVSQAVYDNVVNVRRYCSPANTRTIHNGVKTTPPYEKSYCSDGRVNFCMVARLYPGKNQMMAVKALQKLIAHTDKFTLHLIGPMLPEEYTRELMELVHSAGLDDHVKLWGSRMDVLEILKTMDVGLMLSKYEGFGRATIEYMLNYMPVIGTNTGGTPEIVTDGQTGCLCPLNDSDKLADLMHNFITHPQLLRTMGENGRERAVTHFSVERNTDEIYSLYQEILGR